LPVGFAERLAASLAFAPTAKSEISLYRRQDNPSKDRKSSMFQKHDDF
jgi:hypothetical protein